MNRHDRLRRIQVIDSHTGGEPTRLIVAGGPDLGSGSMAERRDIFAAKHDRFRAAVVNEPRGSDVIVGALLCEPSAPDCAAGVIFFNNVGFLGMCGHGTIGLIATLAHLGRLAPGVHRIETPVGIVTAELHADGTVTVCNVPSYRHAKDVRVAVEGYGTLVGDVAWGGNWFFLADEHGQELTLANIDRLVDCTWKTKQALARQGVTGSDGHEVDHVELFGPSRSADSRNFVLCPGKAYDRSPCGTGTSAKLACLHADGKLKPGQVWRQEGILGTVFEGTIRVDAAGLIWPAIKGAAFVNSEASLIIDPADPFAHGIPVAAG